MRPNLTAVARTGRRVVDACDRAAVFVTAAFVLAGVGVASGIGGWENTGGVLLFCAALVGVKGFLRYGWPHLQRYHERRTPEQRDPTSMRFQGFSADVRVFLTLLAAISLVVFGLMLLEVYLT